MVRHYDSEQEAYATRHQLWEQRVQRERDSPTALGTVPLVDRYMFDLQGFFVVRVRHQPVRQRAALVVVLVYGSCVRASWLWQGAIEADYLAEMNAVIDAVDTDGGAQLGLTPEEARVMMADPHSPVGKEAQQGFGNSPCGGIGSHPVFDRLIGHPGFTPHVKDFVNGEHTVMTGGGSVMQRWPGQASGIHHGGPRRWPINDPAQNDRHLFNFDEEKGTFLCRSVNIMIALNDCPEHGGGTAIVVRRPPPASSSSAFAFFSSTSTSFSSSAFTFFSSTSFSSTSSLLLHLSALRSTPTVTFLSLFSSLVLPSPLSPSPSLSFSLPCPFLPPLLLSPFSPLSSLPPSLPSPS